MGDNRDNSGDSRRFGFIPVEAISGRVFGVAFSLDHDQAYLPRWDRFCRSVD
jgi:signal peptidase I